MRTPRHIAIEVRAKSQLLENENEEWVIHVFEIHEVRNKNGHDRDVVIRHARWADCDICGNLGIKPSPLKGA